MPRFKPWQPGGAVDVDVQGIAEAVDEDAGDAVGVAVTQAQGIGVLEIGLTAVLGALQPRREQADRIAGPRRRQQPRAAVAVGVPEHKAHGQAGVVAGIGEGAAVALVGDDVVSEQPRRAGARAFERTTLPVTVTAGAGRPLAKPGIMLSLWVIVVAG